eukprot:g30281.t1
MVHPGVEFPEEVAPSAELLQLRPYFKLAVYGLGFVFLVELICGMYSAALIDLVGWRVGQGGWARGRGG